MSDRTTRRRAFVKQAGHDPNRLTALPADASPRQYFRLAGAATPVLLMDVDPDYDDINRFVTIARHLKMLGLSTPAVHQVDAQDGFALIEDFGNRTFTRLLDAGFTEQPLYELAVDALIALHRAPRAFELQLPSYNLEPLLNEVALFADWYVPAHAPEIDVATYRETYLDAWAEALADVGTRREALVLRDYHVDNLMVLDGLEGVPACGVLDFQDALHGSRAYDLMSLCQDARRDLAPGLEARLIERYLAGARGVDNERFMADYWVLAAQRHAKVIGIFQRLADRDGKSAYLRHHPRVLKRLLLALEQAGLADVQALFAQAGVGP